jgi:hypothetical protein
MPWPYTPAPVPSFVLDLSEGQMSRPSHRTSFTFTSVRKPNCEWFIEYRIVRTIRRTMILDGKFRGKIDLYLKLKHKIAVQYEVSTGHKIP